MDRPFGEFIDKVRHDKKAVDIYQHGLELLKKCSEASVTTEQRAFFTGQAFTLFSVLMPENDASFLKPLLHKDSN